MHTETKSVLILPEDFIHFSSIREKGKGGISACLIQSFPNHFSLLIACMILLPAILLNLVSQ